MPVLKTVGLFLTFRFDVWTTQSPMNDFLSLSIFGLENVNGVLELSEFRVLIKGNIYMYIFAWYCCTGKKLSP